MKRLLAISTILFISCMQPDSPSGPDGSNGSGVKDQNLLAGATSSTNWPQEDAGKQYPVISGKSDSILTLFFKDTLGANMMRTGKMTAYVAGKIPSFETPLSKSIQIRNLSSISLTPAFFESLAGIDQDSGSFSLLFEFDASQCLITGFTYSISLKKFLRSPFSEDSNFTALVKNPHYSLHGIPDSSLPTVVDPTTGKAVMCFYIPGSPFFFKTISDTAIDIGPLPDGKFPIRVISITEAKGGTGKNILDVFEIKVSLNPIDATHHVPGYTIRKGEPLFETEYDRSLPILP